MSQCAGLSSLRLGEATGFRVLLLAAAAAAGLAEVGLGDTLGGTVVGGAGAGDFLLLGTLEVGTEEAAATAATSGLCEGDNPKGFGAIAGLGATFGFS